MTEKTYKVGDVVAWADVPDGAMVRDGRNHAVCLVGRGTFVHDGHSWSGWVGGWSWGLIYGREATVTIVALGLTGQETAADLQRMAERFEQARTYADAALAGPDDEDDETWRDRLDVLWRALDVEGIALAEQMVAEDAARLLAEHPK